MEIDIRNELEFSIEKSLVIEVDYLDTEGVVYCLVVEPYLLYESKSGEIYCHGWQQSGEYRSKVPPHWVSLRLDKIKFVRWSGRTFKAPLAGFNPKSKQFANVLFAWKYHGKDEIV